MAGKTNQKIPIELSSNFSLIGISTTEPAYKVCWALNQELGLQLAHQDSDSDLLKRAEVFHTHELFSFQSPDTGVSYHLIQNKSDKGVLLSKFKTIDFILVVLELLTPSQIKSIQTNIRNVSFLTGSFELDKTYLTKPELSLLNIE